MESFRSPEIHTVLVLKSDRLYAEWLRQAALKLSPTAQVVVTHTVKAATLALSRVAFDLVIAGFDAALEGDALQLIGEQVTGRADRMRVLVVGTQLEYRTLAVLQTLPIRGVFDAGAESPEQFDAALRAVADGQRYWSPSVIERLRHDLAPTRALCQSLSHTEQLVLSVLGDGSDDSTAAQALGVSPATISTFRRKLHRKLHVQHRGELIRVAAQNGYVRFTPSGIIRPGFAMLAAECIARKRKRRAAAEAAVAAFMLVNS